MNDLESYVIPHINENMRKYNKCHDKCMNDLEICVILDDEYGDCHEWCQKMYLLFQDIMACKKDCSDTYGFLRGDIVDNLSTQRSPIADKIDIYNSMSI